MNSWIITMLSFRARNTSVWETTGGDPFAGVLREELAGWAPQWRGAPHHAGRLPWLHWASIGSLGLALAAVPAAEAVLICSLLLLPLLIPMAARLTRAACSVRRRSHQCRQS